MDKKVPWREKWEALKLAIRWTYEASGWLTVAVLSVAVLGGFLTIIEPYVFKKIIDYLVEGTNPSFAGKISLGIVGVLAIYGIARILQQTFWDVTNIIRRAHSLRVERHIIHKMMENISSLDMVHFEDPEYYNTLTRATENIYRILNLFWGFTIFISELVSVVVIVGALFTFDWRIVAIVLAGAFPGVIMALRSADIIWSAFQDVSPIFRHAQYYRDLLTGHRPEAMKELRLFGLQGHFLAKFKNLFNEFLVKQDRAAVRQLIGYVFLSIIEGALAVFAAWLVVNAFFEGKITIGEVTFFWAILFQFASHARWMVRQIGDINLDATFLVPIVQVLKFKPKIVEPKNPKPFPARIKQGIEFKNVTFYYPRAKKPALKNVNIVIGAQESIALVGENGSGKTTLIKLLCRLYDISEGEILIDGINIKEFALKDLYENIGVIFQDFMKYEALIEENIHFGKLNAHNSGVHTASMKAGAWDFIKDLEKKYKTQVGKVLKKEGVELSGGQWQKIALARAFFKDAQFLILDEPTATVDARAEHELFQKFRHLTKNKTTVLISHRFSTVRMASKIIVMEKGNIIEKGSHEELMKKNGIYAKLFKLQAKGYA